MKNSGLKIGAVVGLCLLLTLSVSVRGEDAKAPTSSATPAASDERIERLEAQLKEALARIEKLETQLADAKQSSSAGGVAQKPVKPLPEKRKPPTDESASYFPKGTKIEGTFTGSAVGSLAMTGQVFNRTPTGAVLRLTNTFGTSDYELQIKDGKAALVRTRSVSTRDGNAPAQFSDIHINGTIDATSISLSGTWFVKGASSGKREVSFQLNAKD